MTVNKNLTLRISGIIDESIVDGPGLRYVVFVQGCPHHCRGCHNPETHDFDGGSVVTVGQIANDIAKDPLLTGVTFSGGEPMCQTEALASLAGLLKERGLDLMIYSGYTYEQLLTMSSNDIWMKYLLETADKLVDGPFVLEQRDLTLQCMGSRNQRFIDLNKTRAAGSVVEYSDDKWDFFGG